MIWVSFWKKKKKKKDLSYNSFSPFQMNLVRYHRIWVLYRFAKFDTHHAQTHQNLCSQYLWTMWTRECGPLYAKVIWLTALQLCQQHRNRGSNQSAKHNHTCGWKRSTLTLTTTIATSTVGTNMVTTTITTAIYLMLFIFGNYRSW